MLAANDCSRSALGGPSRGDVDGLLAFVDRRGAAAADRAAARAHEQVRRAVAEGVAPPGLRRLAEGLTATGSGELPPPPRHPADDPRSVAAAVRDNPLLVVDGAEPGEVAGAVAALVDDGRRVIVTAAGADALHAVRSALPGTAGNRVVDALPSLAPADLHRLRGLLATSTPRRRARLAQQLPDLADLPDVTGVASLCAVAARRSAAGTDLIATVLADLDDDRFDAVTAVAGCVRRSLEALGTHPEPWIRELLADLVHGRRRSAFDSLVGSTAQALATLDDGRDDPPVRALGPLPDDAVDTLVAYLDFRESGGRTRGPFRAAVQRDAEPLLRLLLVGDHPPETAAELRIVLTHFELAARLVTVHEDCAALGLPAPRDPAELAALSSALIDVAAAARAVGALRHDVLFLGSDSPVAVPDVAAAENIAVAVLDYAENGSSAQATAQLNDLASALEALVPPAAAAPEHGHAVDALRRADVTAYAVAVDGLAGARRERHDEQRAAAMLAQLGPLAGEWAEGAAGAEGPGSRFGLAWFTPIDPLLQDLPAADRADVVVVLDAGGLGVDRALLAAAAPRIVAVGGPGGRSGPATLLGLMNRASALVIRGRSAARTGRVVPLPSSPRSFPRRGNGVEQAGA